MTIIRRAEIAGLDRLTAMLLLLAVLLAAVHHTDHVLRVDHSGWPFRDRITPFTYSLLAYPVILFALFGPRRWYWGRWMLLAGAAAFTIYAHAAVESPQMQLAMWAENRSLDPHAAGVHNLPNIRSPILGYLAMGVSMALNVVAVASVVAMLRQGIRLRQIDAIRG